jgi:WD40 repeat protein
MTSTGHDAILDARLSAFFAARAELAASQAPSAEDAAIDLARRVLGQGGPTHGSTGRLAWRSSTSAPSRRATVAIARAAVVVASAALIIVAALLAGTGGPGPGPARTASPVASPTVTANASLPALRAPLGYPGSGVIAFTRHDAAGEDDVWLIEPSGANESLVVPGGCCALFSPDGRFLAAAVPDGGLVTKGTGRLGVNIYPQPGHTVDGTIPGECGACVISTVDSAPAAWSPDGTRVAIEIWNDTDPSQNGMAIAGSPARWVFGTTALGPGESHRDLPIAFSPDGTMLVFVREETRAGPTSIGPLLLLTIADRSARRLTPPGMNVSTNGLIQGPASWTPDGKMIVFAASDPDRAGKTSIYTIGPSPDAILQTILPEAPGATSAHVSPDGRWIAYDVLAAGGLHDVHVVHLDGTGDRNLTGDFDPGVCCGQWSPDGEALLVTATPSDDTHYDLYIVPLEGELRQVTQQPNGYTAFTWGRDPS